MYLVYNKTENTLFKVFLSERNIHVIDSFIFIQDMPFYAVGLFDMTQHSSLEWEKNLKQFLHLSMLMVSEFPSVSGEVQQC